MKDMKTVEPPVARRPVERLVTQHLIRRELRQAGYQNGDAGSSVGSCAGCERSVNGRRGWWLSMFSDCGFEWECWCVECAYQRLHQYDDFDFDEMIRLSESV